MKENYYCYRSNEGTRIYFRAKWIKRRKTYRIWHAYPRCEDVPWTLGWNGCPVTFVERSRRLKSRPTDKTLSSAWDISRRGGCA